MINLHKEAAAEGERVDAPKRPLLHLARTLPEILLVLLLAVILKPDILEVIAYDTDGQGEHAETPDHGERGNELAPYRRGYFVSIAHSGRRHQCPPEGARDGIERAPACRLDPCDVVEIPASRAKVDLGPRVVVSLLQEEYDGAEDEHTETDVQGQYPECSHGPLNRSRDHDDGLEAAAKAEGSNNTHQADQLEDGCSAPLLVHAILVERGHDPCEVGGQDGRQVYEVGTCRQEGHEPLLHRRILHDILGA
mmetsp:Transcript_44082/g.93839  ORF Transcript_44082/g.93839 Transcript_44082/m.93839 type:complete len:251 (-) Transcript_44082:752-1504(-)